MVGLLGPEFLGIVNVYIALVEIFRLRRFARR